MLALQNEPEENKFEFDVLSRAEKTLALQLFNEILQNEQQKAAQAVQAYNQGFDFGGTSVTSLIRKPVLKDSLSPKRVQRNRIHDDGAKNGSSLEELAEVIAEQYLQEAEKIIPLLKNAFTSDEVNLYLEHGVFYGVHISPKLIAIYEGQVVEHQELCLPGFPEPYSLHRMDKDTIEAYFIELKKQRGIDANLSSIVLSDTTTPRGFEGKRILNPSRMNEKLAVLSKITTEFVRSKGSSADQLYMLSTDTDSPHRLLICQGLSPLQGYPLTPGVTICGSTASIEGFDFKFMYRLGLIAQTISNNIVASKMKEEYSPFTFVGMLSPFGYVNGAIPVGKMGELRYEGDIDLRREFLFQYEREIKKLIK